MSQSKRIYANERWFTFSESVKRRDNYKCLQCGRGANETTLQVHHETYLSGKNPWEYALSDCRTLCKGCHAREHGIIEPNRGWILLSIHDLKSLTGTCERKGCGADIRYEHLTYHPKWGYMVVGSTCIEHLTQKDRLLSRNLIHLYRNISKFVHKSEWSRGLTKAGKAYISSSYKHHKIRIYGDEFTHSFQLILKARGAHWYKYLDLIPAKGQSTLTAKELAYTALRGTLSDSEEEKDLLRNLYLELRSRTY